MVFSIAILLYIKQDLSSAEVVYSPVQLLLLTANDPVPQPSLDIVNIVKRNVLCQYFFLGVDGL